MSCLCILCDDDNHHHHHVVLFHPCSMFVKQVWIVSPASPNLCWPSKRWRSLCVEAQSTSATSGSSKDQFNDFKRFRAPDCIQFAICTYYILYLSIFSHCFLPPSQSDLMRSPSYTTCTQLSLISSQKTSNQMSNVISFYSVLLLSFWCIYIYILWPCACLQNCPASLFCTLLALPTAQGGDPVSAAWYAEKTSSQHLVAIYRLRKCSTKLSLCSSWMFMSTWGSNCSGDNSCPTVHVPWTGNFPGHQSHPGRGLEASKHDTPLRRDTVRKHRKPNYNQLYIILYHSIDPTTTSSVLTAKSMRKPLWQPWHDSWLFPHLTST